jgi:hypothetical protein
VNRIFSAADNLQKFCEEQRWRFCFLGGIAVQRWAEPRVTKDVDVTLLTGFGHEEEFIDPLLATFSARRPDARDFALQRRVLLLQDVSGVPLDIAMGAVPFEERSVERATSWVIDDEVTLLTCSAEDLVVHKAFASRDLDWADIERVVMRQGRKLNLDQIWSELRPIVAAKEAPEILTKLQEIFEESLD